MPIMKKIIFLITALVMQPTLYCSDMLYNHDQDKITTDTASESNTCDLFSNINQHVENINILFTITDDTGTIHTPIDNQFFIESCALYERIRLICQQPKRSYDDNHFLSARLDKRVIAGFLYLIYLLPHNESIVSKDMHMYLNFYTDNGRGYSTGFLIRVCDYDPSTYISIKNDLKNTYYAQSNKNPRLLDLINFLKKL